MLMAVSVPPRGDKLLFTARRAAYRDAAATPCSASAYRGTIRTMPTLRQFIDRAGAIERAGLTRETTVGELSILLANAINSGGLPALLTVDPAHEKPHEFRVWRGSQSMVDGLRALMTVGIWPGPADIPSVDRLMTEVFDRNAFATTIWGEGARDEGPWAPLWRERDIRHGLYIVARGAAGEIVVGLFARGPNAPPYAPYDLALAEAAVPFIAAALDRTDLPRVHTECLPGREAPIAFSPDGKLETLGHGALEFLSDAGGGTADAVPRARAMLENAVSVLLLAERPVPEGDAPDEGFRESYLKIWMNRRQVEDRIVPVADTPFGRIDARVSLAVDLDGRVRALGVLRHLIGRRLAVVRALIDHDVPAREFDVALAIEAGKSLPEAAETLGLAAETVKTLYRRLRERFAVVSRDGLLDAMAEVGTRVLR
jgi:DNA-binding CsgD family transcriptional regulator